MLQVLCVLGCYMTDSDCRELLSVSEAASAIDCGVLLSQAKRQRAWMCPPRSANFKVVVRLICVFCLNRVLSSDHNAGFSARGSGPPMDTLN